jgi:DNA-binding MarR family transcriptional regulator
VLVKQLEQEVCWLLEFAPHYIIFFALIFRTGNFHVRNKGGEKMSDSLVQIGLLLKRLNKRMESIVMKDVIKFGLTLSQIMVLRQINHAPKTIGQISRDVGLSNATTSGIIDRLESESWVERVRDCDDRRVVWIHKTDKFEKQMKEIPSLHDIYYREVFHGLTKKDIEQVVVSLQKMDHSMTERVKEN